MEVLIRIVMLKKDIHEILLKGNKSNTIFSNGHVLKK
jgi:hypothetical protein